MNLMKACFDILYAMSRKQTVKTRITWLINLSY